MQLALIVIGILALCCMSYVYGFHRGANTMSNFLFDTILDTCIKNDKAELLKDLVIELKVELEKKVKRSS